MSSLDSFLSKALEVAKVTGITLPKTYYRYGLCKCWNCNNEILVFTWPEHDLYSGEDNDPRKEPIPRTVKNEHSNSVNSNYWVNTCPYCNRIQGDFYMYMEPDGPFFSFEFGDDTEEGFQADLIKLANYASENGLI